MAMESFVRADGIFLWKSHFQFENAVNLQWGSVESVIRKTQLGSPAVVDEAAKWQKKIKKQTLR